MLTLDTVYQASFALKEVARVTDLIRAPRMFPSEEVYLKTENLQTTGSFKVRGAYYKISRLSDEQKKRGVIACSAGNHAQGVALAASRQGIDAVICIPEGAPISKVEATRAYGAKVELVKGVYDDAYSRALEIMEETGRTMIHPFNDPVLATGQGTIAYEIFSDLPDVDIILVPVGGGGLASGVATLTKLLNPNVQVIGVEPTGAASMKASLEAGHIVTLDKVDTIADGVAVKTPGDKIFPYIQKNLDGIITIDDHELVDAFLDMMEKHKMIVENAGLLSIAALSHLDCQGKNVVSVLSGGNMDVITVSSLVQHGLVSRGRVFTFSVQLPDRPGELVRVAERVAELNGNIIRLDHNQFVNINRQSGVELRVTLEAFGLVHKGEILAALRQAGYDVKEVMTTSV